jgi:hypothetical protein
MTVRTERMVGRKPTETLLTHGECCSCCDRPSDPTCGAVCLGIISMFLGFLLGKIYFSVRSITTSLENTEVIPTYAVTILLLASGKGPQSWCCSVLGDLHMVPYRGERPSYGPQEGATCIVYITRTPHSVLLCSKIL